MSYFVSDLATSAYASQYQVVGYSLSFFSPSAPLNLAGNVEVAYIDNPGSLQFVTSTVVSPVSGAVTFIPRIPRSAMTTALGYKCVPAREKIRVIHNPCADSMKPMIGYTSLSFPPPPNPTAGVNFEQLPSEYIYILVTGATSAAALTQFTLVINYVVQLVPTSANMCTASMALAPDAPATLPAFIGSVARHPSILFQSIEEATKLCDSLRGDMADFSYVREVLLHHGAKLPGLETIQHAICVSDGQEALEEAQSFEIGV